MLLKSIRRFAILLSLSLLPGFSSVVWAKSDSANIDLDISVDNESKEVGLKRLEIIDKLLSSDLIARKKSLVASIEADYNQKITSMLKSLISPVIVPKVITHIDINFFAPEFDSQLSSHQKLSTSILIKKGAFGNWEQQNGGRENAISVLKDLISTAFNIPKDKVSIVLIG